MLSSKFQFKEIIPLVCLSIAIVIVVAVSSFFEEQIYSFLHGMIAAKVYFSIWVQIGILGLIGIISAILAHRYSIRRILPFLAGFIVLWFILMLIFARFGFGVIFLPGLMVICCTILFVHARKIIALDSYLENKLKSLSHTGSLLEGKSAELRVESGLSLLEALMPNAKAVVFQYKPDGGLEPLARSKMNDRNSGSHFGQSDWREMISFSEKAIANGGSILEIGDADSGSARAAIPLMNQKSILGILFVRIDKGFENEDQYALQSFAEQIARNFHRREFRRKKGAKYSYLSLFSSSIAKERIEYLSLIEGLLKEQGFAAMANSELKEAHAISYLDGTLAYFNRQMRKLIGPGVANPADIDLMGLLEGFKTADFSEPHLAVKRVLQSGDSYERTLHFEDKKKYLKLRISLVKVPRDEESIHDSSVAVKPACFLVSLRDITAIKENEKLRSDMANLMSHELRTPITSIKGFAELLLLDDKIQAESREFLTIISNESMRLSNMLQTFLSVSNLQQSDKQEFQKAAVRVDELVHQVIDQMQEPARKKRIRLVENNSGKIPPVAADRGLLMKAIGHLIDNAIRYSPDKTSVIISTILEADFLKVVVEDRGYGIPADQLDKIWQKFYRVEREGTEKQDETTGLGLSFVKEITEKHGGKVIAESKTGLGSRFSLLLPRL